MDAEIELEEDSHVACPLCETGSLLLDNYNYHITGTTKEDMQAKLYVRFLCDTCGETAEFTAKEGEHIVMRPGKEE